MKLRLKNKKLNEGLAKDLKKLTEEIAEQSERIGKLEEQMLGTNLALLKLAETQLKVTELR